MKFVKAYFALFILPLIFFSCNGGEQDDDSIEDVKFFVDGYFNGEFISYQAGKENYYLFTNYELDTVSVHEFNGQLKPLDCNPAACGQSLTISIRDEQISSSGESYHQSTLSPGSFNFRAPVDSSLVGYQVDFNSDEALGSSSSFIWTFDGLAPQQGGSSPSIFISSQDAHLSPLEVNLVNGADGRADTLSYRVHFNSDAWVDFSYDIGSTQSTLTPIPVGQAPLSFRWDLGNGYLPTGQPPVFTPNPSDSTVRVCIEITDDNNQKAEHCKHVILDSNIVYRLVNFHYQSSKVYEKNVEDLREVLIVWVDENGKEYRSDRFEQLAGSNFEIVSSSEYELNENGLMTHELDFRTNVVLYGDNYFDRVYLTEATGTWAVAHPN